MEQSYYNPAPLKYVSINESTDEIVDYINKRRKKISKSLKTKWMKFNTQCMGGIEPNTIYSICGISGSGKSSFVNSLESDLFELNKDEEFVVLNFSFEMLNSKQVGRKLSYKLKRTTSELYSGSGNTIDDREFEDIKKASNYIRKYPIYYVDVPGNVEQIKETILQFSEREGKDKWVIIILDHTLLTKGKAGESEREIIAKLQYMFMEMKKKNKNTIIQLSQMNRNIESVDRISNQTTHFPMRTDIFGSDSLFQASDYVIVLHRPELLGIAKYGPSIIETEDKVFLHILKNREGGLGIIKFRNNLKYNELIEVINEEKTNDENRSETVFIDL